MIHRLVYLTILALTVIHVLSLVVFLSPTNLGARQNLTITGYSTILIAVALMTILRTLRQTTARPLAVLVGGLLLILWLGPNIVDTVQYVMWRDLPVSHGAFAAWAGETLPPQDRLLVGDFRPFTEDWSCYAGPHHLRVDTYTDADQSIDNLRQNDIAYIQLDSDHLNMLRATDSGRAYLGKLTLMAQFPPPEEANQWRSWRRGSDSHLLSVYSVVPIAHQSNMQFGDSIRLLGYTLEPEQPRVGDVLLVRLYWEALAPIEVNYQVYLHLTPPEDRTTLLAQGDGPPAGSYRPTSTWYRPGELMLVGRLEVPLPSDLEAGDYVLRMGLYDILTGQRLLPDSEQDELSIPLRLDPL